MPHSISSEAGSTASKDRVPSSYGQPPWTSFETYQTNHTPSTAEIVTVLQSQGYPVLDLSGNELAKLHIRHLVGGQVPGLENELLYRFEFPERPGALMGFLQAIGDLWNISLFHYRNHGSDYGRVLAGVQVPESDRSEFAGHLAKLGYTYWDETANPAYRLFLHSGS